MERRSFTKEFKLEAVKLIKERGVSVAQASQDLGVHQTQLSNWVQRHKHPKVQQVLAKYRIGQTSKAVHAAEDAGEHQLALGFDDVGFLGCDVEAHAARCRRDLTRVVRNAKTHAYTPVLRTDKSWAAEF